MDIPSLIKKDIENKFNITDLSLKTRKRPIIFAKKLLCKILFEYGYTYEQIKPFSGLKCHGTILHHCVTFSNDVYQHYRIFYNELIDKYNLDIKKENVSISEANKEPVKICEKLNSILGELDDESIDELINTRIIPFVKMKKLNKCKTV